MELIKVLIILIVLGILYQIIHGKDVERFEIFPKNVYLDGKTVYNC